MNRLLQNRSAYAKTFILTAGVILTIAGVAKFATVFGGAGYLADRDGLFSFLSNRQVFLAAGALELSLGQLLLFKNGWGLRFKLILVAWITTLLVAYRLGLLWVGYEQPCSCLGLVTDWMPIKPAIVDLGIKGVLGYLAGFSYLLLILGHRRPELIGASPFENAEASGDVRQS